jgi:glycosyltransferase involved in cell wall biosynthesis
METVIYNISANIICKNEAFWIKESILSIVNIVDEIIYIDDRSSDGSLEIVEELSKLYNNIKIFKYEHHKLKKLGDLKNFGLKVSKNEFVIRWDADFIAYNDIDKLFKFCEENKNIYDGYILTGPNLSGDIYHQPIDKKTFGPECYLFNKNKSKFVINEKYPDYPSFDEGFRYCYPQKTSLNKNYFFIHTNNLKSIEKLAYRNKMCKYHLSNYDGSYWNWLNPAISEEESKKIEIQKTINTPIEIIEFNFEKWGEHPKILLESESSKLFSLKIEEGKYYIDKYPIN